MHYSDLINTKIPTYWEKTFATYEEAGTTLSKVDQVFYGLLKSVLDQFELPYQLGLWESHDDTGEQDITKIAFFLPSKAMERFLRYLGYHGDIFEPYDVQDFLLNPPKKLIPFPIFAGGPNYGAGDGYFLYPELPQQLLDQLNSEDEGCCSGGACCSSGECDEPSCSETGCTGKCIENPQ